METVIMKQDRDNEHARRQLRKLKERYDLTWPEVAKIFGRSLRAIEDWYGGQSNIPYSYKELIHIYLDNPEVFDRQRKKQS